MIKVLVLDFGGVLFPIQPYLNGVKPEEEKFHKIKQLVIDIYSSNEKLIKSKKFTKEDFTKQIQERGKADFTKEELNLIIQSILVIDQTLLDYLRKAKDKYAIFALINEAPKWTELRIYFHNLNTIFKDYFISSYLGVRKPDPQIFKIFLEKTGLKSADCLFIDDKEENLNAARSLGFNVENVRSHRL